MTSYLFEPMSEEEWQSLEQTALDFWERQEAQWEPAFIMMNLGAEVSDCLRFADEIQANA